MRRYLAWLALSGLVIVIDQATKFAVSHSLAPGQSIEIASFFDLVFVFNPGAAFSFLADHDGWQRWLFTSLGIGVSIWLAVMLRHHAAETLLPAAFALIIGGAIGNVIDRVLFGAVIDFLYFHLGRHGFPAFNVADSAISVGVALMLWDQVFGGARQPDRDAVSKEISQ